MDSKYHFYNKGLRTFACRNRNGLTKAEACLWKYALKAKQTGYTFNRQRPVLNYIADFMCKELKLIIEVDGSVHLLQNIARYDSIRQQKLEAAGFKVIRFKNEEILRYMEGGEDGDSGNDRAIGRKPDSLPCPPSFGGGQAFLAIG